MAEVRIETEDFSVNALVNTLLESESISVVYNQWTGLARQLDLPEELIDEISSSLFLSKLKNQDILPKLLHNWLSRKSDRATLSNLVIAFRKCSLNIHADLLERKFIHPSKYATNEASSVVTDSSKIENDSTVNPTTITPHARMHQIANDANANHGNYVTRTLIRRARRVCVFKRGRNYGIRRLFRKSSRFISHICFRCCQIFSNTFSFIFPLFLVLFFLYRVIILPSIITTTQKPVKTSVLTSFSRTSGSLITTVVPFKGIVTVDDLQNTETTENWKSDVVTNPTNVPTTLFPTWVSLNATVESWQELVKLMSRTNSTEEIDLTINFDNMFKWGDDLNLCNSHRIKSLWIKGQISLDNLANLVKQMPLLQNLVLDNSENKLCARNKGQLVLVKSVPENSVHLPILETLRLKDFSNCVEILESLVKSYDCKQLKSLEIEERIDNHNIHHVQELIAKYKTIKTLDLYFVNSCTKYFYKSGVVMDKVTKLKCNMLSGSDNISQISLGSEFCRVFRNISYFKIETGCVPYKELENLLLCDKLKIINIVICINNNDVLSGINFTNKLVKLEYVNINLQFEDPFHCPSLAKVRRLGLHNVGQSVKEMLIVSNCPIKRDKAGIEYKSDWKKFRS